MHDSRRYRGNATDCLLGARAALEPHYKRLNFLMAQAWLSFATEDSAVDGLLAKWEAEDSAEKTTVAFVERLVGLQMKPASDTEDRRGA
jgi:carboxylesterase type B